MCFPSRASVQATPPAPPPPTPPPPPAPKPLKTQGQELVDDETRPITKYGKKKAQDTRDKKGGIDSLRIPLNVPNQGGNINA